jgi:hydroxyethylthiazole kinase-like uncharacterized protein yjeF
MMKVVSPKEMARLESVAYGAGASELTFMERAGAGVSHYVEEYVRTHRRQEQVLLICGKGNNAGDAFVAGRYLLAKGFEVSALQCCLLEDCSPLCRENGHRFTQAGGFIHRYTPGSQSSFPVNGVIIDGLFGTGFEGDVKEPYASLIQAANASKQPILAVDIPSGLNGATGKVDQICIMAAETIFLGLPKTGFFLLDGWNFVGRLRHVDFGLTEDVLSAAQADFMLSGPADWRGLLPPIQRNRHKYQAGYVIGLAGSETMPGAAILAAFAALRGGAGIVKLLSAPAAVRQTIACPPEIIPLPYDPADSQTVLHWLDEASATFVGPGLGQDAPIHKLLAEILPKLLKPCVVDADALTAIAKGQIRLPPHCLLTPHRGEMARLLGYAETPPLTLDLLQQIQRYVEAQQATLVLKGGPSFIASPQHPIRVIPRGDPGMAKAGTGDVLTGLLAALLAQGLGLRDAATLGVALHGIAGECVVQKKTSYGLVASDITEALPQAYSLLLS